jgi:hypothetical protein
MVGGLVTGCRNVGENLPVCFIYYYPDILLGMRIADENPVVKWENGQGHIGNVSLVMYSVSR